LQYVCFERDRPVQFSCSGFYSFRFLDLFFYFILLKQSVIEFLRSNISFLHPENLESGYRLLVLPSLLLLIRPAFYHNNFRYESHSGCTLSEHRLKSGYYNGAVLIFISSTNRISLHYFRTSKTCFSQHLIILHELGTCIKCVQSG
jgi:hypothetical protein